MIEDIKDIEMYIQRRRERMEETHRKYKGLEKRRPDLLWARMLTERVTELELRQKFLESIHKTICPLTKPNKLKKGGNVMFDFLKGRKSYILMIIGAINVIGGLITGEFGAFAELGTWGEFFNALLPALGLGTLRAGVAKIGK